MDMRGKPACYGRFDGGRMQHTLGRSSPPVCSTRPSINYRSLGTMGSWHNVGGSMAAWLESPDPLVVDLRKVTAADLAPLLEEETAAWRAELDWDFEPSADLVRRFVEMQALNGFALMEGARTIGYSYYIREEKKDR